MKNNGKIKKIKTTFGSQKILMRKKTVLKNSFFIFNFIIKNTKENKIQLKFLKNLRIFKLINSYIMERNK